MTFRLTKHHGLGNDFLVHLTDDPAVAGDREAWVERAQRWCHRHRGIGADGLLVGLHGPAAGDADLVMLLVNADGSIAEMSGNGIRCFAQAEALRRNQEHGTLRILTDGGLRTVEYAATDTPARHQGTIEASVDMGPALPGPQPDQPADEPPVAGIDPATLGRDRTEQGTYDLGNPHLVLLVPDPGAVDLEVAGPLHEGRYSEGMNVHFVAPTPGEADAMTARHWERGAGVTEACGTGATAIARAAHDWGLVGEQVTVHMPGGDVQVVVGDPMILRGPSVFIAGVVVTR